MTGKKTEQMSTGPEKAVVYARYSSRGQQEQSIEGQLAAAYKYAEKNGYTIVHEYCDRAKTGTNDNREAFQQMLADTAKKVFTVIIVWKVDRFGRNREEITFNKYRCKKNGVRVEYVAENVTDGPEGVILESVLEGMAEYYSLQLSQNVKRGQLESAKKHHVLGGTSIPYGYRVAKDKTYEIDPDEAPIAKKIFEMYASGETSTQILAYLNSRGYKTKKGTPFRRAAVLGILKNEKYIGVYKYKDIIRDEDAIPSIIDKATFEKVQKLLKANKVRGGRRSWSYVDYVLTGKLFCGKCGSQMAGVSGINHAKDKYSYYACMRRHKAKSCDKKSIRQDVIEPIVLETVNEVLSDPKLIRFIADKTWEIYQKTDTRDQELKTLQKQLAAVEKGIGNLLHLIENGLISETVQNRIAELEGQKAELEKLIAQCELSKKYALSKDFILFTLEKMQSMDRSDRSVQKKLIDVFVNSIYLYDDKVKIVFNYSSTDPDPITFEDIKKAGTAHTDTAVFERSCSSRAKQNVYEPICITWFASVFSIDVPVIKYNA